jgi:hypothetical protein
VITKLDGHLAVPTDYATNLIDILDLLAEVLRYAGDELREDVAARYQPGTYQYLIEPLDSHTGPLRRATSPTRRRTVTP